MATIRIVELWYQNGISATLYFLARIGSPSHHASFLRDATFLDSLSHLVTSKICFAEPHFELTQFLFSLLVVGALKLGFLAVPGSSSRAEAA